MQKFSNKFVQKIKIHTVCSITFSPENHAIFNIHVMWKNMVHPDRPKMTT